MSSSRTIDGRLIRFGAGGGGMRASGALRFDSAVESEADMARVVELDVVEPRRKGLLKV